MKLTKEQKRVADLIVDPFGGGGRRLLSLSPQTEDQLSVLRQGMTTATGSRVFHVLFYLVLALGIPLFFYFVLHDQLPDLRKQPDAVRGIFAAGAFMELMIIAIVTASYSQMSRYRRSLGVYFDGGAMMDFAVKFTTVPTDRVSPLVRDYFAQLSARGRAPVRGEQLAMLRVQERFECELDKSQVDDPDSALDQIMVRFSTQLAGSAS